MIPKKKIIGLSIGRVNGNSEILLKEALMGVIVPLNRLSRFGGAGHLLAQEDRDR
jgi:hypothetical protein